MKLFKKYLFLTLGETFFPIFFTLYAITSVVFLVKIASLTSVITMSILDLIYLYMLNTPLILLYTLPITFFMATILNISKLSAEYELIVITSFGLSPLKILKFLAPTSFLLSIALLLLGLVTIPQIKYLEQVFINTKKQNAQFNIKPSEYGQKFGPWYIYVEKKIDGIYQNITLLEPTNSKDTFIQSKKATIKNNTDFLELKLFDGSASIVDNTVKYINFDKMIMNNYLPQTKKISSINDLIEYWSNKKKLRMFMENIFLAILPFISLFFYITFGYFNPRYQKNNSTIYGVVLSVVYVVFMSKLAATRDLNLLLVLPPIWIIASIIFYKIRIRPYY